MSTLSAKAENVDCGGAICGREICRGHTIEVERYGETVGISVDGQQRAIFENTIWEVLCQLEQIK